MRSILGALAALLAAAAFALAGYVAFRPGAGWLDGQWLFLVALPYNWASLHGLGESHFSPDSNVQLAAAFAFDVALAFLAGAAVEAAARGCWRLVRRVRARA